mgnify:CR=1 FL=1
MGWDDKLSDFHDKGQTDASNGEYHRPHGVVDDLGDIFLFVSHENIERREAENKAYDEGHAHTESQKGSGCFLTAACVQAAGLPDDCHELTTLRRFRDSFIRALPGGEAMIKKYYDLAPQIVEKLSAEELKSIYATVQLAVAQIGLGKFSEAFSTYAAMFRQLSAKHLGVRV